MSRQINALKLLVKKKDFLLSSIGGTIVTSAIIHSSYTKVIPLTQTTAGIVIIIPAIFIGLLNDEIQEAMYAMLIAIFGSLILISFARIVPGLLGIFPSGSDVFAYQQIGETLPLFFLMFPLYVLGTMFGVLINEFLIKDQY